MTGATFLAVSVVPAFGPAGRAQGALIPSAAPAQGPSAPAGLDNFLCYTATSTAFKAPVAIGLKNQFLNPGIARTASSVGLHCNPVQTTVGKTVTKIVKANARLMCRKVGVPPTPGVLSTVKVTNQFGTALMQTDRLAPNQLCVPSWTSLTGLPNRKPSVPPGLSPFSCYGVSYVPGAKFRPPARVVVTDEFSAHPVSVTVGAPQVLCLPTTDSVGSNVFGMQNPAAHLLCFGVSATPTKTPAYEQNQFGQGKVSIANTTRLCLPTIKFPYGTYRCTDAFETSLVAAAHTSAFHDLAAEALQDGCVVYTSTLNLNLEFIRGPKVGQEIVIGPLTLPPGRVFEDIALTYSGVLYGIDGTLNSLPPTNLYRINTDTAVPTLLGPIGGLSGSDILDSLVVGPPYGSAPPDGTIYAAGGSPNTTGGFNGNFYKIDPSGPTASLVGAGSTLPYVAAGDLAFTNNNAELVHDRRRQP